MKRWIGTATVVLLVTLVAGCGSDDSSDGGSATTLRVFAASSLTSTFETLGKQFEASHDVDVQFNFGGSSDLVAQLQDGAPGDAFASADTANMDKATAADLVDGTPV